VPCALLISIRAEVETGSAWKWMMQTLQQGVISPAGVTEFIFNKEIRKNNNAQ